MPRVVIVGFGSAGLGALHGFTSKLGPGDSVEVVIFEKCEYYYFTFGVARALTDKDYQKKMFIPYDNVIPAKARGFMRFERAVVTSISTEPNLVHFTQIGTDDTQATETQTMAFDYLILATGSTYTSPIKPDPSDFSRVNMERQLAEIRDHIERSSSVLIDGGGGVGCEFAADIAEKYPNKKVILASSSPVLVAAFDVKDSFRSKLLDSLATLNVEVLLGERLEE